MASRPEHLYAIIDAEVASDPVALAAEVLRSGCAMLQLRAKRLDDRAFAELGTELRQRCRGAEVPFIVNDRPDLAQILKADGLHLGQDDLTVADARHIVGNMRIGVSTHDPEQALQAESDGADIVAFGPVFSTATKENPDPVVGLDTLGTVCRNATRPVVAIGGITPENATSVLRAGASYLAVISSLPRFLRSG